jgi:hypothetical protein
MKLTKIAVLCYCALFLAACTNEGAWVEYHNENFNYKVLLPEMPTIEKTGINLPTGLIPTESVAAYDSTATFKNLFMVSCTKFATTIIQEEDESTRAAARETLFSNVVTQLLNDTRGQLVYERSEEVVGLPARAFRIEYKIDKNQSNYMTYKTFVKDDLQFVLQTITAKAQDQEALIEQFMNSFEFSEIE